MHACCEGILLAIKWFWIPWLQTAMSRKVGPLKNSKNLQLLSHLSNPNTVPCWAQPPARKDSLFKLTTEWSLHMSEEMQCGLRGQMRMKEKRGVCGRRRWSMYLRENVNARSTDKNMSPFNCKNRPIQANLYLESPKTSVAAMNLQLRCLSATSTKEYHLQTHTNPMVPLCRIEFPSYFYYLLSSDSNKIKYNLHV